MNWSISFDAVPPINASASWESFYLCNANTTMYARSCLSSCWDPRLGYCSIYNRSESIYRSTRGANSDPKNTFLFALSDMQHLRYTPTTATRPYVVVVFNCGLAILSTFILDIRHNAIFSAAPGILLLYGRLYTQRRLSLPFIDHCFIELTIHLVIWTPHCLIEKYYQLTL